MHRPVLRLIQAALLAIGVSVIPLATVSACSCAMADLGTAIADAEVAIVGTVASVETAGNGNLGKGLLTTWSVASSRDPVPAATLAIYSIENDGANCGISFGKEERWMVLAYRGERGLETNGCMMNRRLDGSDPEAEALIAEAMTPVSVTSDDEEANLPVPAPLIGLGAVALVVLLISLVAFRRSAAT